MGKVQDIIHRFFEIGDHAVVRNIDLQRELKAYGNQVVVAIHEDLRQRKESGTLCDGEDRGFPVFFLLQTLAKFAWYDDCDRLLEILLWNEILLDPLRSNRSTILGGVKRIGGKSAVPVLQEYAERVKEVRYQDHNANPEGATPRVIPASYYYGQDQEEVADVIVACGL